MKRFLIASSLFAILSLGASAQVTLVFNDDTIGTAGFQLDGLSSGSATFGGVTLSATSFSEAASQVFNATGSNFGINADGTDTTSEFDQNQGFTFSFNQDVTLNSISVNSFGGSSAGSLDFDGGANITSITATGLTSLSDTAVSSGTVLRFTSTGTSAFSLANIVATSAVPEPSSFAALAGLAMLGFIGTRRRRSALVA